MKKSDTSEKGFEDIILSDMCSGGWTQGASKEFDTSYVLDLTKLEAFLKATQPQVLEDLGWDEEPSRHKFLSRLQGEVLKHGVIKVLRDGVKHGPHHIDLYAAIPTKGNSQAEEEHAKNIFSVTRQLHFSKSETALSLDLCAFINGLPVATFELKNKFTKQTVEDAVTQYRRDRDPKEPLFRFGVCMAHFALDDHEVKFCTRLLGKRSWFLPFNKGNNHGGGNPVNPKGLKTDYLWKDILSPPSLCNIIENFAQIVTEKDPETGEKKHTQIFPRFHQLDVVRKLLAHVEEHGAGQRYLIQHSAGSGKSNSIAWLSHQLVSQSHKGESAFDSIIVVTDRRVLDGQIKNTIKHFAQVSSIVGHAQHSSDLKGFIEAGKKIIITTVQKFPHILDSIGQDHRESKFAIIIDEAHSSQGGKTAAAVNMALSDQGDDEEDETTEDKINRIMETRKMLSNASYFAFTATPKNKTLELFGTVLPGGDEVKRIAFHQYTMKQAIEEGFIMDVLKHYTPVKSYYKLVKTVEDDPQYDTKKAKKKLRRYVESHEHAIKLKAEIMVDHFHDQVISHKKVGGDARAMVVTNGIARAIQYYFAIRSYLKERKSPYQAIVAFSGEHDFEGEKYTEAKLNGFPSNKIKDKIRTDPYRFLICADKFQTGYDEPLLHTMYVDNGLSGIKAVQTLSRLNRAHPKKKDVFVLDFQNDADQIQESFARYYRTTILSKETDPNKLHDLYGDLGAYQVYTQVQVNKLVVLYLDGAERDTLDPILDQCVQEYLELDEDGQVDFKSKAKAFCRTYGFLSSIMDWNSADLEKLSIFLNFLVPKLPAPKEEDLSKGVLEAIDMDSYRAEKKATMAILLPDADVEIDPVPTSAGGAMSEPELDPLSAIIQSFNDEFGNVDWEDGDQVRRVITEVLPEMVSRDEAYVNAKRNSDKQNARIESDKALGRAMLSLMKDNTELFKQYSDNEDFKRWLGGMIFNLNYGGPAA